eukprot:scaffold2087_cov142-Isochrysis_galbana.AAC.1
MRAFAKRIARLCSLCTVHETGAHSFRIGGATDMPDGGIPPILIQARGRWASDIFHIYTRDTVEQQFRAADAILSPYLVHVERLYIESVFAEKKISFKCETSAWSRSR